MHLRPELSGLTKRGNIMLKRDSTVGSAASDLFNGMLDVYVRTDPKKSQQRVEILAPDEAGTEVARFTARWCLGRSSSNPSDLHAKGNVGGGSNDSNLANDGIRSVWSSREDFMKRWIPAVVGSRNSGFPRSRSPRKRRAARHFESRNWIPALDDVIAPDAQLETLGDRFALTEGPVWMPAPNGQPGYLLFSDNAANVIYKWAANSPSPCFSKTAASPAETTPMSAHRRSRAASRFC